MSDRALSNRNYLLHQPLSAQQGVTTVEVSLSIFPALLIVIGLLQLSLLAMNSLTLQYSLQKAVRFGILGSAGTYASRSAAIDDIVRQSAQANGIDSSNITVTICPESNPTCAVSDPGSGGQFVILSATKPAISVFGVGLFPVAAKVIARNEPF